MRLREREPLKARGYSCSIDWDRNIVKRHLTHHFYPTTSSLTWCREASCHEGREERTCPRRPTVTMLIVIAMGCQGMQRPWRQAELLRLTEVLDVRVFLCCDNTKHFLEGRCALKQPWRNSSLINADFVIIYLPP